MHGHTHIKCTWDSTNVYYGFNLYCFSIKLLEMWLLKMAHFTRYWPIICTLFNCTVLCLEITVCTKEISGSMYCYELCDRPCNNERVWEIKEPEGTCMWRSWNTGGRAWKTIGNRLLKPCYLSKGDHNPKIRTRKQRTDVGKYSLVNRTIKSWNQLTSSLLTSFPCKLNTFRKRVKNVVTSKWIQVGVSVNK